MPSVLLRDIVDDDLDHMTMHLGPDLPNLISSLAHSLVSKIAEGKGASVRAIHPIVCPARQTVLLLFNLKRSPKPSLGKIWVSVIQY
jgi:hypothetical protein